MPLSGECRGDSFSGDDGGLGFGAETWRLNWRGQGGDQVEEEMKRRVEAQISDYNPQAAFQMRPLAFEISQRESVSTLHCNVSLIEGIATDSFVANFSGGIRFDLALPER